MNQGKQDNEEESLLHIISFLVIIFIVKHRFPLDAGDQFKLINSIPESLRRSPSDHEGKGLCVRDLV